MQGYIYLIENKINGKCYVGKTARPLKRRFIEHLEDAKKYPNRPLYRAINKYGKDNFEIKELECCDVDLLDDREKFWISHFNTYLGSGYNATYGGGGKYIYDYDLIVNTYLKLQNVADTAKQIGCSVDCITSVLNSRDIKITSNEVVMKDKFGKKIKAIDYYTKEEVGIFNSQIEAGQWLIDTGKTTIKDLKKLSYVIGRTARGLDNRKKAYGYEWIYL